MTNEQVSSVCQQILELMHSLSRYQDAMPLSGEGIKAGDVVSIYVVSNREVEVSINGGQTCTYVAY